MANLPRKQEGSGKRGAVSPEQFAAWRDSQGLSMRKAAEVLGVSFNTVAGYERDGAAIQTGFAMAAIAAGLDPWSEKSDAEMKALRSVLEAMRKTGSK